MPRWSNNIEQSKQYIEQIKVALENYSLEDTNTDTKIEILRAQKAIEYTLKCLKITDPDLITSNAINNINSILNQTLSYITSKQSIQWINDNYIDSLLQNINQYIQIKISKLSNQDLTSIIATYSDGIKKSLDELNFTEIKNNAQIINNYKKELLDNEGNIKSQILNAKDDIDNKHDEIDNIYNELDKNSEQSIYGKIKKTQQEIQDIFNQISQTNTDANTELEYTQKIKIEMTQKLEELDKFHNKIFGQKGKDENGKEILEGGINEVVNRNLQEMENLQKEYKDKFDGLYQIGTNASLASSYEKERRSFVVPKFLWTALTLACITSMCIAGALNITSDMSYEKLLLSILYKAPIYLPLIWLTIFSIRRRAEAARLEQEYTHKVAVTSSYESYKTQIMKLDDENKELLKTLMSKALEIISKNPSDIMDKKIDENPPLMEVVKDLIEKIPPINK